MGQQQLLLLVLGVVIVGLAVVVGINAFSQNQIRSNADALVNDGLRIASDLQAYALKPEQFGGGGGWDNLGSPPNGEDFGYAAGTSSDPISNVNGDCELGGDPTAGITITCTNDDNGNEVEITVTGTSSENVETDVTYGS